MTLNSGENAPQVVGVWSVSIGRKSEVPGLAGELQKVRELLRFDRRKTRSGPGDCNGRWFLQALRVQESTSASVSSLACRLRLEPLPGENADVHFRKGRKCRVDSGLNVVPIKPAVATAERTHSNRADTQVADDADEILDSVVDISDSGACSPVPLLLGS